MYRDPRNNSLQHRAQITTIIGISEELKGYKVCLRKENRVIVTQHVQNIDTLSDAQNSQLQNVMNNKDRDVTARDSIPAAASAPIETSNNDGAINTAGRKTSKKNKKQWTQSAHGTRSALKRAQVTATQEESSASDVVLNATKKTVKSWIINRRARHDQLQ